MKKLTRITFIGAFLILPNITASLNILGLGKLLPIGNNLIGTIFKNCNPAFRKEISAFHVKCFQKYDTKLQIQNSLILISRNMVRISKTIFVLIIYPNIFRIPHP